jgi:Xaa-Pro aminopeptidase
LLKQCRVLSLAVYQRRLGGNGRDSVGPAHIIREVLRENRVKKVQVPPSFPLGLARDLRRLKVKLKVRDEPLFRERECKSADEIKKISAALTMAEVGLAEGLLALRNAKIGRDRRLHHHNAPLTSEKLRAIINTAILQAGGCPPHTIVAGGRQACDPHEPGHGPLRANEPIVIDVFPRSRKTGYYGDITRTVVRGRASEGVRRLYETVRCAQELAFARIQAGVTGNQLHQIVQQFFEHEGFPTRSRNGRPEGFFHGIGHGVGLELHEYPRIGAGSQDKLCCGNVVTIEPGLYYSNLGAVRLEDVVLVTTREARNLTKFEKTLEL